MIKYEPYNDNMESPYAIYTVDNLNWELHFHRAFECILVLSGEINCTLNDNIYTVSSHRGLFIMPNQPHSICTETFSEIMIVRFYPEVVSLFFSQYHDRVPATPIFSYESIDWKQLLLSRNLYHITGYLYQLCGCIAEQARFVPCEEWNDSLVHKIFHYVEDNYLHSCSLREISNALGYEATYLSRTFRKHIGITYISYVNHRRIAHACFLMEGRSLPFIAIAGMCGFDSLRSFNRNFAKICGCSPTEYRNKVTARQQENYQ